MIPRAFITEWRNTVPWQTNEHVEQDLVICRALVHLYSDEILSSALAFRGGTALNKLYLSPPTRYSEDIDLVQIHPEPIKRIVQQVQNSLAFLGKAEVVPRRDGIRLKFRFESEIPPSQQMRLKVEINTREHFSVLGYQQTTYTMDSSWLKNSCILKTYKLEELLGTKLRALYQRRKGRDLFDLYKALVNTEMDMNDIIRCYHEYMEFSVDKPPTRKQFMQNIETKMKDAEFLGDTKLLIMPTEKYNHQEAFELVKTELIDRI